MTQWRAPDTRASFMVWVSDLCVCSFVPLVKTAFTYTYVIEFRRCGKTPISPSPNFWTCSHHNVLKHNHGTPSLKIVGKEQCVQTLFWPPAHGRWSALSDRLTVSSLYYALFCVIALPHLVTTWQGDWLLEARHLPSPHMACTAACPQSRGEAV